MPAIVTALRADAEAAVPRPGRRTAIEAGIREPAGLGDLWRV
ncbi:MAG: hypothetical protein WCF16_12055 [Alphaproteobacteria bacterium]